MLGCFALGGCRRSALGGCRRSGDIDALQDARPGEGDQRGDGARGEEDVVELRLIGETLGGEGYRLYGVVAVGLVGDTRDAQVAVGILAQFTGSVGGLLGGDADVDGGLGQIICRALGGDTGCIGVDFFFLSKYKKITIIKI